MIEYKFLIKGLIGLAIMCILGYLTLIDYNKNIIIKYEDILGIHYELD